MLKTNNSILSKFLHSLIILLFIYGFGFLAYNADQTTYLPFTLARYDNTLFATDYNVITMSSGFTTQFFIDVLFIIFMKLGISWIYINGILYTVFLFIFSLGIVMIVHTLIDKHMLFIELFFSFCIQMLLVGNALGDNNIWLNSFFNQTPAVAVSIWGLYYALQEKPRWLAAAITIAIAGLFHIQVAFYMYLIIFCLMICCIVKTKNIRLFLTILPVISVAVISFALISTSNSFSLSDKEFTAIYSILRHPHHLVPSYWPKENVLYFLFYTLLLFPFGFLCAGIEKREKFIQNWILPTCIMYGLAIFCVIINYLFVEVIPWSFISKLYPERFFLALRFWLIIYLFYCVFLLLQKKQYFCIVFLIVTIFTFNDYFFLALGVVCFVLIGQKFLAKRYNITPEVVLIYTNIIFAIGCFSIVFIKPSSWFNVSINLLGSYFILSLSLVLTLVPQKTLVKKTIAIFLVFSTITTSLVPFVSINEYGRIQIKQYDQAFMPLKEDFKFFCEQIKKVMPESAIFLSNPSSSFADNVRLFSERSHIISWKNVPTNDRPLLEWVNRLIGIGFVSKQSDGYITNKSAFLEISAEELLVYAKQYGADFVLLENNIDLERFLQTGQIEILVSVNSWYMARIKS